MIHRYGMRMRPFSIGAFPIPKTGFVVVEDKDTKGKYHDVLQYHYKLSEQTRRAFELSYLGVRDE